jgi:hypothetical protein
MQFFATKIIQFKTFYQNHKLIGTLLLIPICFASLFFLPEILFIFAPKFIFTKIWNLKISKFYRIIWLILVYIIFGIGLYVLYNFIHGLIQTIFHKFL